jgi:two-component system phosphate regulon sensor histidine kinase PhoR
LTATPGSAGFGRVSAGAIISVLLVAGALVRLGCRGTAYASNAASRDDSGGQSGFTWNDLTRLEGVAGHAQQDLASLQATLAELRQQHQSLVLSQRVSELRRRQNEIVIDNIADPVLVADEFDRLVLVNPAGQALLAVPREAALRRPLAELGFDAAIVRATRQCREADRARARVHLEQTIGERVWDVSMTAIETQAEEGSAATPRGVVIVMRDITREKEVAKAKSSFVSQVAHELRTPLASIRAYVEMLVDGEATDARTLREYYEIIQTSSDRLARLIDNMLNISRIESGTIRVSREPVSIAVVVKEVVDVLRPQAEEKQIELDEELTPVVHQVLADRDMISQAVLNLVSNAVKYTPAGGRVAVRMSVNEESRCVQVAISDSGAGIPEQDLPRLFEKFFRVEANQHMAKGTGLGLHLVKHLVETVHGGTVSVASQVGKGSTFTITLPLHA